MTDILNIPETSAVTQSALQGMGIRKFFSADTCRKINRHLADNLYLKLRAVNFGHGALSYRALFLMAKEILSHFDHQKYFTEKGKIKISARVAVDLLLYLKTKQRVAAHA